MPHRRQLRLTFLVTLTLFVGGMLGISGYALWRLHAEALANGLETSAMHARDFEAFLTQSLRVTDLMATNALPPQIGAAAPERLQRSFAGALRHAPFLRSISLQDASGRIVASSNPANVGVRVATEDYLPPAPPGADLLRLGQPWAGRDFAGARPSSAAAPVSPEAASFIPLSRGLPDAPGMTLLVAINPDYFVERIAHKLGPGEGAIEVLRYDGIVLIGGEAGERPGAQRAAALREWHLPELESGQRAQDLADGRPALSAMRASPLYPFAVLVQRPRESALRQWRAEARVVAATVALALLVVCAVAIALYRRQSQLIAQRQDAERRLRDSERLSRAVADNLPGLVAYWDRDLRCRFANARHVEWFNKTPRQMLGMRIQDLLGPVLFARNETHLRLALQGAPQSFERTLTKPSGEVGHIWANYIPDLDADGGVAGIFMLESDVTQLKRAEEDQRIAATAFESNEAMAITDANAVILRVNQAFSRITGYAAGDIVGRQPNLLKSGRHDAAFYDAMWSSIHRSGTWQGEIWDRRKNGEIYPNWLTITAVKDGHGGVTHYVANQTDISARKQAEEEIHRLAFFDALTGLANRRRLMDRLAQALATSERSGRPGALMFIDLDRFKILNDTLGHDMGDLLLQQVAARLCACVKGDGMVARLGGDEFVVLLVELEPGPGAGAAQAAEAGVAILAALNAPYDLAGQPYASTPSIGATLFCGRQAGISDLLKRADDAMYQAKTAGRNALCFFGSGRVHKFSADAATA
jgi:diguanylate cyclase (GGDEF)-like protein/PAS domain S-box-containing protein